MKRKRKNMTKRETAKTNNDKSFYKNFVIPCVIFFGRIIDRNEYSFSVDCKSVE